MAVKIKICGITDVSEIEALNRYLPDYVGFVFARSKRQISPDNAMKLLSVLDKNIKRCGVFVNEDHDCILSISKQLALDVIQLHGNEDIEYIKELKKKTDKLIWKGCYVNDAAFIEYIDSAHKVIADSMIPGSGRAYDRGILDRFSKSMDRIIIAGGLDHLNVSKVLKKLDPYCVDVSSGVEESGLKKDHLINKFIKEVRKKNG